MTDATLEARTLLWEWASEREDADPEERAWTVLYAEALLDACEHSGLLSPEEVVEWRRLLAHGGVTPPAAGNRDAAERHLEELLAALRPLSRNPEPADLAAGRLFYGALAALHASGVLSDDAERRWRSRSLAAEAPWLADNELSQPGGTDAVAYAVRIPPASPEEDAADAAAMREMESLVRRGRAKRVFVPDDPRRHDGLAIVAVVTRTEATEVVFHQVGDPQGDAGSGRAELEAFRATLDALVPPRLEDDAGTSYEPVGERPVSGHGNRRHARSDAAPRHHRRMALPAARIGLGCRL